MAEPILTFDKTRRTNAELLVACRDLGYLSDDMLILDATYGKGRFWKLWRPEWLLTNDWDPACKAMSEFDYRDMPFNDDWFGAVVFDPEYKLNGTSTGKGPAALDADYGVAREYRPMPERTEGWLAGFDECVRVCKPGGHVLVKIMDQVVSGNRRFLSKELWLRSGAALPPWSSPELVSCRQVDEFYLESWRRQPERTHKCKTCGGDGFVPNPNEDVDLDPAPSSDCPDCDGCGRQWSPQQHAQQSLSVLMVFRKANR